MTNITQLFSLISTLIAWLDVNIPFRTNTAISKMKDHGWRIILLPSEGRLATY